VEQREQSRRRPTRRQLLWAAAIAALAFLIFVICGYLFGWKWTGLPKQTLWDWLDLLIVPAVLGGGGVWFNWQQRKRELDNQEAQRQREVDNQETQRKRELEIEEQRAQDAALQAYIDQMSQLLTDKDRPLYRARPGDSLSTVARARTLTVLTRLDAKRKRSVLQFLYESDLIKKEQPVVSLAGASLEEADLAYAQLSGAGLEGVNLKKASLDSADLGWAVLRGANLQEASLDGANLLSAILTSALLKGTSFVWTNLKGADLQMANPDSHDQFDQAYGDKETTLPEGIHRPNSWLEQE
jgi:uncharacterized protein YjbI with pentapeptide repeats